jgi:hypothetical protein
MVDEDTGKATQLNFIEKIKRALEVETHTQYLIAMSCFGLKQLLAGLGPAGRAGSQEPANTGPGGPLQ